MSLLRVENLSVLLGGYRVVEKVSFELEKGDSLAIIGPNGAGKTVLIKALLGLVPFSGKVFWQPGVNPVTPSPEKLKLLEYLSKIFSFSTASKNACSIGSNGVKIGYVPQKLDFDRYLPLSVEDFLAAKIKILGLPRSEIEKDLSVVGFTKQILKSSFGSLSFGQFQKALILFALIGDPDALLLDEATLGVDAPYETQIYDVIYNLQKERHLTIILISHEFEIVYKYMDKVLCLNKKMVCFGAPERALTEGTLAALYKEGVHYRHRHG